MLNFSSDSSESLTLDFSFLDQTPSDSFSNLPISKYEDFSENSPCYSLSMNICGRRQMQDRVKFLTFLIFSITFLIKAKVYTTPDNQIHYFAVFDGHGSEKIADFLSNPISTIKSAFALINQEVTAAFSNEDGGSVVIICIIVQNRLFVVNLGDSRAILIKKNQKVFQLNCEHTPDKPEECQRIERMGGYVINVNEKPRVQGSLAVTRSIGDPIYKPFVSCEPDIYEYGLDENSKYLVLASDGLWNECRNEDVGEFLKGRGIENAAKQLIEKIGEEKGFIEDNTTVICVDVEEIKRRSRV